MYNGWQQPETPPLFFALFRICLFFALGFAAFLVVLHSQPPDDADLRVFVTFPERCETGCFMGLRPGFTPIDRAIRSLERNGWVSEVRNAVSQQSGTGDVSWQWSDEAPEIINTAYAGRLSARDGVVTAIVVDMRASVGTLQLALNAASSTVERGAYWKVIGWTNCLPSSAFYWRNAARLELSERSAEAGINDYLASRDC